MGAATIRVGFWGFDTTFCLILAVGDLGKIIQARSPFYHPLSMGQAKATVRVNAPPLTFQVMGGPGTLYEPLHMKL